MERKLYIGVTGFTSNEQVRAALAAFPTQTDRSLMVGVLASQKSIKGIPLNPYWQEQTPSTTSVPQIFPYDERVLNLVHYSADSDGLDALMADMFRIHQFAGLFLDGIQINYPWPEGRQLSDYRFGMGFEPRVVLQIGSKAIEQVGGTPEGVINWLKYLIPYIDDILFDGSGGRGKPLDPPYVRPFLAAVADLGKRVNLGVAGGLGPDTLHLVEPLLKEFPNLNIDAQKKLRDNNNNLDLQAVKDYLQKAVALFS